MKIYVKDYAPKRLLDKSRMNLLEQYFFRNEKYTAIYSANGNYIIDYNNIYKTKPLTDGPIKEMPNYFENMVLLLDETNIVKEKVNQIPVEHISMEITKYIYSMKYIKLVVEGIYIGEVSSENKYNNFTATDFYFEVVNDTTDITNNCYIKNELNVFLSILN